MRNFAIAALALTLAATTVPVSAQSTGMKNGSADTNTTKARCSPGDPNVMLDVKSKTYTLDKSASDATKGAMASGDSARAGGMSDVGANATGTNKNSSMKSVCKSEADSMGAKMAKSK